MLKLLSQATILVSFLFLGSLSFKSIAQDANVNELRTFFTSKQTRQKLDSMRASGQFGQKKNDPGTPVFREPNKVKMQGIVIRENKTPVVFVNDENTIKTHHLSNDVTVRDHVINKKNYKIPVRVNQQGVTLRPGQQWNEVDRKVKDDFQIKPEKEKPKGLANSPISDIIN